MSASREKKMRQQTQNSASAQTANTKKKNGKTILYSIIAIVVVALVVFFTLLNTNFFQAHAKVATVGNRKLTAAEMNYWLMDTYNQEQSNSGFTALVDTSVPLSEQACPEEDYETWYDYMLNLALETAANTYAVYDEATAAGFTLSESGKLSIDSQIQMLEMYAPLYGFADVNGYLTAVYGKGCKVSSYKEYLTVTTVAQEYETFVKSGYTFTQEDLDAYYAEHSAEYDVVRFRVFNVVAEGTTDETGSTVYTEDAIAAAEQDANVMYEAVLAGGEEAFKAEALARTPDDLKESYDPDLSTLADFCTEADAVNTYGEWFADENRAYGDVLTLKNDTGCYVIFYLGKISKEAKLPNVRHILVTPEAAEDGTISPEAWAAAKAEADAVLEEYKNGEATEDSFAALADSRSADTGSVGNGGLYTEISPLQMVAPFANWCFGERTPGETGIVKTSYGYHVMYFSGESDVVYGDGVAEDALCQAKYDEWVSGIEATTTYKLNTKKYISVI